LNPELLYNILIVDESLSDIERYSKQIKELGYNIKLTRVEDQEDIEEAFKNAHQEVLLFSYEYQHASLQDTTQFLKKLSPHTIVICLHDEDTDINLEKTLDEGAHALIDKSDKILFKYTIKQQFECIAVNQTFLDLDARYKESEKRSQILMTSSKDAIAYIHEGMHVTANNPYLDLFGLENFSEIEGLPIMNMVDTKGQDKFKTFLRTFNSDSLEYRELKLDLKDSRDTKFVAKLEFSPATIDGEHCTQIIIRDRSDNKMLEKQLSILSKTDQLTGLLNHLHLVEALDEKIKSIETSKDYFSFFFISIDRYSELAEQLGVMGSDSLISAVAKSLHKVTPKKQLLCRFTGHTFCLMLDHSKIKLIKKVSKVLISAIEQQIINVSGHAINPTISIGMCIVDSSIKESADVLDRAEKALIIASKAGTSQSELYKITEGELSQTQLDNKWKDEISQAIEEKRFVQMFQPIISLLGDPIHRYKTVPLLFDEEGNNVEPEEYMLSASRTGVSISLDRWLILETLQYITKLMKQEEIQYSFFITLSNASLQDPGLFRWLSDQLELFPIPDKTLVFSVNTESALPRLKQTRALAAALLKLKCEFSLENFGSGPNPFQIAKHIPFDYVKVHPDFVNNLSTNAENQDAIREMSEKAQDLGKKLIVDGIVDPGSLTILWGLGVQLAQGDFFGTASENTDFDFSSMGM
jgi:diguanylate cyclase (GGDEF)-like protein